jgi:hypothetical protein
MGGNKANQRPVSPDLPGPDQAQRDREDIKVNEPAMRHNICGQLVEERKNGALPSLSLLLQIWLIGGMRLRLWTWPGRCSSHAVLEESIAKGGYFEDEHDLRSSESLALLHESYEMVR